MDLQDENTAFHITFNSLPDKHHLPLTLIPELRTDKRRPPLTLTPELRTDKRRPPLTLIPGLRTDKRFYSARKQAVKEIL